MREVKSKGRYPELVKVFLFRNGWGLSIVEDTFDTDDPYTCIVRQTSGDDYKDVPLSNSLKTIDSMLLWQMWDWYYGLGQGWPMLLSEIQQVTGLGWARYISRLPYDIHWNELVTFVRPNGLHVCGQVDDVATEILRQYIDAEQEDLDLLEILCDRLEDHPA